MTNTRRVARADQAVTLYDDEESALRDLLADLLHWAKRYGWDFDAELEIARMHFDAEDNGEE